MLTAFIVAMLGLVAPQKPCLASSYSGSTGQAKIQAAINDGRCAIVEIDSTGPDSGGVWEDTGDILLRSRLVLRGPSTGTRPTIKATATGGAGMLRGASVSYVTIENLILDGNSLAPNGIWIAGCDHLTITNVLVQTTTGRGVHLNTTPCSDVLVTRSAFTNNTARGFRTDTSDHTTTHSRVLFTHNTCSGGLYCVAVANCGISAGTACGVRSNVATSPTTNGFDFNRVAYGDITGNTVTGTANGITVDDVTNSTFLKNTITSPTTFGIVFANGGVAGDKPWHITGNTATLNTITGSAGTALYMGASSDTTNDQNDSNSMSSNTITGNSVGCGKTATYVTNATFSGNGADACNP